MVDQNELLTLLVALGVLIFAVSNRAGLKSLPSATLCLSAFVVLVAGLAFTVLEGLAWGQFLNILEHLCYGVSSVLLAAWVWIIFGRGHGWQKPLSLPSPVFRWPSSSEPW